MKENQVVEDFFRFSSLNGWKWKDTGPIVKDDSSLLFHISGGAVFDKELSGISRSPFGRIASFQDCLRTDNWEKIGYSGKHHLLFGMIGHFMLFESGELSTKKAMISTTLEFVNGCLGIPLSNLAVSVHPDDMISYKVWESLDVKEIRMNPENTSIDPFNLRHGTRTEIIFLNQSGVECELWNIVFHSKSYNEDSTVDSRITADSGASIDRLIRARNFKDSDYETGYWSDFVSLISSDSADRIRLSEMLKASAFLLNENLVPGNKGATYVLRKVIRESYNLSSSKEQCLSDFIAVENYWLSGHRSRADCFKAELDAYRLALARGEKEMMKILNRKGRLSEEDILFLSGSFGYPKRLLTNKTIVHGKSD